MYQNMYGVLKFKSIMTYYLIIWITQDIFQTRQDKSLFILHRWPYKQDNISKVKTKNEMSDQMVCSMAQCDYSRRGGTTLFDGVNLKWDRLQRDDSKKVLGLFNSMQYVVF